jgi:hypothetical protein
MAERRRDRWLRPRVILPAVALILLVTAILSPMAEEMPGRYLSTRSRAINGSQGLRQIYDTLGWKTSERVVPFAGAMDSNAIYFMLDTPLEPSPSEVHVLLEAVRRGARAIVVPERGSVIADSIGVRSSQRSLPAMYPVSDSLLGRADPVDTLREQFGALGARSFHRYLEGTPATDSDSVGAWPTNAKTMLYVRTLLSSVHSEIITLPFERGEVVAIADPTFLRNDVLRKTAGAVLAVRIVESVDSTGRSPLVFDEYHQGFGETSSPLSVVGAALVDTTWGRAIVQLGIAALLYLMMVGVRPIAPTARARLERRSPLEHVGALSRAYEGVGATALAVQRLVRGIRRRHPLGAAAQLTDSEYLARLRTRLPALAGDIDTLAGALVQKPTTAELVAAGAAIDHIERNLIT